MIRKKSFFRTRVLELSTLPIDLKIQISHEKLQFIIVTGFLCDFDTDLARWSITAKIFRYDMKLPIIKVI